MARRLGLIIGLLLLSASCGMAGPSHADVRSVYLDSLFAGSHANAFRNVCATTRDAVTERHFASAFEQQSDALALTGEWAPLRGSTTESLAEFMTRSGGSVTLVLPVVEGADGVQVCPTPNAPLGIRA